MQIGTISYKNKNIRKTIYKNPVTKSFGNKIADAETINLLTDTIKVLNRHSNSLYFADGITAKWGKIKFSKGNHFTGHNYILSEFEQENGVGVERFYYLNTDENAEFDIRAGIEKNGHGKVDVEPITPKISEKYLSDIKYKLKLILWNYS